MAYTVLFDEPQEAAWFKALHPDLRGAAEVAISNAGNIAAVRGVLGYDRPDVVLLRDGRPILVVEETIEVPSGHNVGQRFARLAAAAEHHVPCLFFGPYKAKKHGGDTAGPRYMNLRLFYALDAMERVTGTAVTTINWPVDQHCEVLRGTGKDADVREYVRTLLAIPESASLPLLNSSMLASGIHQQMMQDRAAFARTIIRSAQYNNPPKSVSIVSKRAFAAAYSQCINAINIMASEIVLYQVGMTKIRSDPYAGMAMLYHYLYIAEYQSRALVLWFPNITSAMWRQAASNPRRKDVRLYRHAAEGILFSDGLVAKADL